MELEDAIKHAEEKSGSCECGKEHAQLAKWLKELTALRASPASVPEGFTMSEPAILPDGSGFGTMTEREATLLGKVERQSAALKLAREALKFDGYPCGTGCKCIACESLAAIDSLQKGE